MKKNKKVINNKSQTNEKITDRARGEEPYVSQLNGNTINRAPPWPKPQLKNEKMFLLPKILSTNDTINIYGETFRERRQLTVGLVTGFNSPDHSNVACQLEIYFLDPDKISIQIVQNGNVETINEDNTASDYFADPSTFDIQFRVRSEDVLDVVVGESLLESIRLKHNVNDIRFLSVHGDIDRLSRLDFNFG